MKSTATLLAGAVAALAFAMPAVADDAAKASMKAADDHHAMTKKQAKADEKSRRAQCGPMSGDAKEPVQEGRRRPRTRRRWPTPTPAGEGQGRLQGEEVDARQTLR